MPDPLRNAWILCCFFFHSNVIYSRKRAPPDKKKTHSNPALCAQRNGEKGINHKNLSLVFNFQMRIICGWLIIVIAVRCWWTHCMCSFVFVFNSSECVLICESIWAHQFRFHLPIVNYLSYNSYTATTDVLITLSTRTTWFSKRKKIQPKANILNTSKMICLPFLETKNIFFWQAQTKFWFCF